MSWTEIGGIPSMTSKNTRYAISVNEDGHLGCNCSSWIHSTAIPKTCKHTVSPEAGGLLRAHQLRQRSSVLTLRTVGATTYDYGISEYTQRVRKHHVGVVDELLEVTRREYHNGTYRMSVEREIRALFVKLGVQL